MTKETLRKLDEIVRTNGGQVKFKDLPAPLRKFLADLGLKYRDNDIIDDEVVGWAADILDKGKGSFPVHPLEAEGTNDIKFLEHDSQGSHENSSLNKQKDLNHVPRKMEAVSGTSLHEANEGQIEPGTSCSSDEKGDSNWGNMGHVPGESEEGKAMFQENGESSSPELSCSREDKSGTSMFHPNQASTLEKKEVPRRMFQHISPPATVEKVKEVLSEINPSSNLLDELRSNLKSEFKLDRPADAEVLVMFILNDNTPKTWGDVVQFLIEKRFMDFTTARKAAWSVLGKKTEPSSRRKFVNVVGQKKDTGEVLYNLDNVAYLKAVNIAHTWAQKVEKKLKQAQKQKEHDDMMERIVQFLEEYGEGDKPIYIEKLKDIMSITGKRSLDIDYNHIIAVMPDVAEQLLIRPNEIIQTFEDAVTLIVRSYFGKERKLHVRIYNLPKTLLPKQVDTSHINKFIQIEGVVTRLSPIKPFIQVAVYVCPECGEEIKRYQKPYANFTYKPRKCPSCGSRDIRRDDEKSVFLNYQSLRLQDPPERLSGGVIPRYIDALLIDDLVDTVVPGDRVLVTGTLKVVEEKYEKRPIPKTVFIINHVTKLTKDIDDIELSAEDVQKIEEEARLAREGKINLVERMVASIAPSIHGWKKEKLGLLLALFSGDDQVLPDGTTQRHRIHVLMAGDPAVSKSHLLEFLEKIAPRAQLASGESSSGAGLTAAVVKGEDGDWVLEAGTLVLADRGYALIDELDKMNAEDRTRFHRPMEQGDIRINKAGINATLNARTCVIAAANPKYGQWSRMKSLREQIDLPPTILSRFDLIFVMLDEPDEDRDDKIFSAIASRWKRSKEHMKPPYDPEFLKKYITYAKKKIKFVELTEEAEQYLRQFYLKTRLEAMSEDVQTLPITTRQAQALLRLAEAHARLHLRDKILVEDAKVAKDLMLYALSKSAVDIDTGRIDLAIWEFGKPMRELKDEEIVEALVKRLDMGEHGAPIDDIVMEAKMYNLTKRQVMTALRNLMDEGKVYSPRTGFYRCRGD